MNSESGSMDRKEIIDGGKNLRELDLGALAELCGNVARNLSADHTQSETAHRLRVEWLLLSLAPGDHKTETDEESLKGRMVEFLSDIPVWMMSGV